MDPIVHLRKHATISDSAVQFKYAWYGDVTLINLYNQTWLLTIIFKAPSKFWNRLVIAKILIWIICTSPDTEKKFYVISSYQTNTTVSVVFSAI